MTLLQFAEKTTTTPLTSFQRELLIGYENAVKNGKELIVCFGRYNGRTMLKDIINRFNQYQKVGA